MFIGGVAAIFGLMLICTLLIAAKRIGPMDKSPKGFLDYRYDAEIAISALPSLTGQLTIIMGEVGGSFGRHTAALQAAGSTNRQLLAIRRAAANLDKYSARVDRICVTFVKTGRSLSDGLVGWSRWLKEARPNKAALGTQFPEVLRTFIGAMDTSNNQRLHCHDGKRQRCCEHYGCCSGQAYSFITGSFGYKH